MTSVKPGIVYGQVRTGAPTLSAEKRRPAWLFVGVLLTGLVGSGFVPGLVRPLHALDTGDRAPQIGLEDLNGNTVDLSELRGKVILVDFWASWCEPCKDELPFLNRLYRAKRGDGFVVIGVSVDRRMRNVRSFLRDTPVSFPVVHDDDQDVADRYNPPTMPTSFLIDSRGVVRFIHRGFREGDEEEITDHVEQLLEERQEQRQRNRRRR